MNSSATNQDPGFSRHNSRRRKERLEFSRPLPVREASSGVLIGELQNLTSSGMMMYTQTPFHTSSIVPVVIDLPHDSPDREQIDVTMQCRWCHERVRRSGFKAGFRFVRMTFRQKLLLETFLKGEAPEYADLPPE